MSNGQVPGPLGRNGNTQSIDDGTLRRSLSHVPGVLGTSTDVSTQPMVRPPPLLPTSAGVKPPPTIQFGSRGPLVERLQQLLNERLVPSPQLAINGTFDAAVLAAVKQYQQHLRLTVDGRVGKDTWYRLHKGDIATIPGTPKVVTQSIAPTKPNISTWTLEQKFTRVLELTPPKLPGHMREEFMKLLDPMSLAIIVGTLIVWAASHAFGIGAVIDIVMLIGGVVFIGMAALDAAKSLYDFLTLTCTADKEADLDQAAVLLAKAVSILGVGAFTALVTKGAAKRFAKKAPIPEQKPLMKEPGKKVAREDTAVSIDAKSEILSTKKGDRPEPSTYLDKAYVDRHLEKFNEGASFITKKKTLETYGREKIGMPDNSQFVMPKDQMDDVLRKAGGDISIIEKELGIPKGTWQGEELVRIDIPNPGKHDLRMPTGNEMGANEQWLPGGKLPTGYDEAVTNQIIKESYLERPLWK